MSVIFCADPGDRKHPDPMYISAEEAVRAAGCVCSLLNFEVLGDEQDADATYRRIGPVDGRECLSIVAGCCAWQPMWPVCGAGGAGHRAHQWTWCPLPRPFPAEIVPAELGTHAALGLAEGRSGSWH
jgi:hypothetical protein